MHLASALIRIPPLMFPSLPCSLPSSLNPSSARFLPPLFPLRRSCLGPSLPCSYPSATLPSSTDTLSLPIIIASSLPPSCYLVPTLPLLPPSLPSSILPRSFSARKDGACLPPPNSMCTVCVFGKLHCIV